MPAPALAAPADRSLFRGYRFPPEIIGHAVWLYFRFHLSFRDVQDLLAERGLIVSHESIRQWCDTFGPTFAGSVGPASWPEVWLGCICLAPYGRVRTGGRAT